MLRQHTDAAGIGEGDFARAIQRLVEKKRLHGMTTAPGIRRTGCWRQLRRLPPSSFNPPETTDKLAAPGPVSASTLPPEGGIEP